MNDTVVSIIEKIALGRRDFNREHPYPADRVYLGLQEYDTLRLEATIALYSQLCAGRIRVMGLDVYRVDADSHFWIA